MQKALAQENKEAVALLGAFYLTGVGVERNEGKAIGLLKQAADAGVAEAQYNLGVAYREGKGTPKDDAQAFYWFEKASRNGYVKAYHKYAFKDINGVEIDKNELFRKLKANNEAESDDSEALLYLALKFETGVDNPFQDPPKAAFWFKKRAEKGVEPA